MRLAASIWAWVRHDPAALSGLHSRVAGSKRQRRASEITPSSTPSSLSQAAMTALLRTCVLCAVMAVGSMSAALALQLALIIWLVFCLVGAPAMMPSYLVGLWLV